MGKRGPRPKLNAIQILEGNPSKRFREASGVEAMGQPFVPEHLMDDARGCIEVIQQSMPDGVYSTLDSFHLAAFGMAWAIHKRAALEISSPDFNWISVGSKDQEAPNPWFKILNQQAAIIMSLGDRLGLDPKARASLKLPGAGSQRRSKFIGLIGTAPSESSPLSNN